MANWRYWVAGVVLVPIQRECACLLWSLLLIVVNRLIRNIAELVLDVDECGSFELPALLPVFKLLDL